jgi:hypothetical protein
MLYLYLCGQNRANPQEDTYECLAINSRQREIYDALCRHYTHICGAFVGNEVEVIELHSGILRSQYCVKIRPSYLFGWYNLTIYGV